jgi:hypothetical protein
MCGMLVTPYNSRQMNNVWTQPSTPSFTDASILMAAGYLLACTGFLIIPDSPRLKGIMASNPCLMRTVIERW